MQLLSGGTCEADLPNSQLSRGSQSAAERKDADDAESRWHLSV